MKTSTSQKTDTLEETPPKQTPSKRRKARKAGARPPKRTANELTCDEAEIDALLSAGELT